jgi:CheY-like chemotaxis protein
MPRHLLLADDSVTIQKVVGITFAAEDFTVTTVDNGEDALARAREQRPDVILADVVMPRRNGYELCEAVKSDPALSGVPVLLLAGAFEAFDEARAKAVRADGHIGKPFESQPSSTRCASSRAAPPRRRRPSGLRPPRSRSGRPPPRPQPPRRHRRPPSRPRRRAPPHRQWRGARRHRSPARPPRRAPSRRPFPAGRRGRRCRAAGPGRARRRRASDPFSPPARSRGLAPPARLRPPRPLPRPGLLRRRGPRRPRRQQRDRSPRSSLRRLRRGPRRSRAPRHPRLLPPPRRPRLRPSPRRPPCRCRPSGETPSASSRSAPARPPRRPLPRPTNGSGWTSPRQGWARRQRR